MTETEQSNEQVDPESTPFAVPAVEGLPYEDGSAEAKAIERILAASQRESS